MTHDRFFLDLWPITICASVCLRMIGTLALRVKHNFLVVSKLTLTEGRDRHQDWAPFGTFRRKELTACLAIGLILSRIFTEMKKNENVTVRTPGFETQNFCAQKDLAEDQTVQRMTLRMFPSRMVCTRASLTRIW